MNGCVRGLITRANRNILSSESVCCCHAFRGLGTFRRTGKTGDHDWNKAVSDAEKVVGYPTSFLSLRCFLSDEFSNVAMHMRKLVVTKHPLLHTLRSTDTDSQRHLLLATLCLGRTEEPVAADWMKWDIFCGILYYSIYASEKYTISLPSNLQEWLKGYFGCAGGLMYDVKHSMQTRGLIVLLISKAAGPGPVLKDSEDIQEMTGGIYPSQRSLAEITEVIHLANLIHKGIVNMDDLVAMENGEKKDMEFGNKMAVLSGDFLLASASTELAKLRNTYVVEHISKAIGDQKEAEFTDFIDDSGRTFLKSDIRYSDWLKQTFLSSASLLARSCLSAMELANHSKEYQSAAYKFGEHMAYAQQINEDLKPFKNPEQHLEQLNLTSLPVIKYMEKNEEGKELLHDPENFNCKKIHDRLSSTSLIKECQEVCQEMGHSARKSLEIFDSSEAKDSLLQMVDAIVTS